MDGVAKSIQLSLIENIWHTQYTFFIYRTNSQTNYKQRKTCVQHLQIKTTQLITLQVSLRQMFELNRLSGIIEMQIQNRIIDYKILKHNEGIHALGEAELSMNAMDWSASIAC